uniref:Uncharacterized protein n=1 Tax=Onchocerca volvulus TaxID=6282 RepID=A0A8R1TLF8_ONCVO
MFYYLLFNKSKLMFKFLFPKNINIIIHFLMAMINMNVMALSSISLSPLSLPFSPSLLSLTLSSSSSPSSSSSSLSSPSSVSSTNHETIMTLCKKRHIVLDHNHPEYVISFPITTTDNTDNKNYKSSKENYLLSDEKISERKFPYPLDFFINKITPTSQ